MTPPPPNHYQFAVLLTIFMAILTVVAALVAALTHLTPYISECTGLRVCCWGSI